MITAFTVHWKIEYLYIDDIYVCSIRPTNDFWYIPLSHLQFSDEGLYTVTASNLCGSISYSVILRILEDEQEYDWMAYRRSKQIVPRTKGFEKFYHTCEEIGRGTQGVTYFVQQIVPIEADQSGHHCVEEAESKYWWLHRGVKSSAPTIDPVMIPYRWKIILVQSYWF